ncbi:MAG: hypothetical protein IT258_05935, partial [Saprospiraceae bacterium]|nr:hypothetical protein [Saprospiraceae bacterium]
MGTNGGVYISPNAGKYWELSDVIPHEYYVLDMEVYGDQIYIVAGPRGTWEALGLSPVKLYRSNDLGKTWHSSVISNITMTTNHEFEFIKSGSSLLFRWEHYICYRSMDDGDTWSQLPWPQGTKHVSLNGSNILTATYNTVNLSTDLGNTWQTLYNPGQIEHISLIDSLIFVSSANGNFTSTDLGQTWVSASTDWTSFPNSYFIFTRDNNGALLATNSFYTFISFDNGTIWEVTNVLSSYQADLLWNTTLNEVEYLDSVEFSVGFGGVIKRPLSDSLGYFSNDGISSNIMLEIKAAPNYQVYLTAHSNPIWHSTNNGRDWSGITGNAYSLFLDYTPDTVFFGGANGLYYYANGVLYNNGLLNPNGAHFQEDNGIFYTIYFDAISALDKDTWTFLYSIPSPNNLGENWQDFLVQNGIFIGIDQDGKVYRTIDKGVTWEQNLTGVEVFGAQNGYALAKNVLFYINNQVYALGRNGLWTSTDMGITWSIVPTTGLPLDNNGNPKRFTSIAGTGGILFGAVWAHGIYVSYDNGQSWAPFNEGLNNLNAFSCSAYGDMLYLSVYNGGVWKRNVLS